MPFVLGAVPVLTLFDRSEPKEIAPLDGIGLAVFELTLVSLGASLALPGKGDDICLPRGGGGGGINRACLVCGLSP